MKIYIDRITGKAVKFSSSSPLFLEVTVKDALTLKKVVEVQDNKIQKTNGDGQPLYKANLIIDEMGIESYEETIEENSAVGEPLQPVMIPNMVSTTVSITTHPEYFTLEEIVEAKYKHLLENSDSDYIIADLFIDENDLDLSDEKHSANTGYGILQLLPQGQAQTNTIDLEGAFTEFTILEFDADQGVDIYLAGHKFEGDTVSISDELTKCTIKFVNTTDKPKHVRSYAIGY